MRKTILALVVFFITQTTFAAFPKPESADTIQSSLLFIPSSGNMNAKRQEQLSQSRFTLFHKGRLYGFHDKLERKKRKGQWLVLAAGFLLGLTGIGYAVSRLTKNESLRDGATIGFRVFLYICIIYLAALLIVLLLFTMLGLI